MTGEKNNARTALCSAFVLISVAAFTLALTTALLARAGMPFGAAYTAAVIAAIIGTLAVSRGGRTLLALPSPAITAWLVYEEIISRGLLWQEALGIVAITSCLGAALMRTQYADALRRALPSGVRTALVLGLGVTMLMTAALYARILLPSPWALTMGGTAGDPLTYFTLMGILLTLVLSVRGVRAALPLGMLLIALLTWAEGFWEIPAAPFLEPEAGTLVFALTLPTNEVLSAAALGLTLLYALAVESAAILAAQTDGAEGRRPLARLFAVSGGAALIGAFPLTIAPISLALPEGTEERRIAEIPLTACITALFLLLLLPCAPLVQAMADFPAVPAVALAVTGLQLLARALHLRAGSEDFPLRGGAVTAIFLLVSYDILTGLTCALFTWTLLTAAHGERVPRRTWCLTTLLALCILLKGIQI